ncbi:glutaredoxin 3 [Paraperlucidibaca baekdonensis]|uniref:Glutaredoxin n=1 Tax=Paraperlucidibaca baekdonensis TaxID=748120 RepID=A0A3E0H888_9GAMM|nr:glutaredoxin 3 [Paraperlucidibaca baekdonensis]REH39945.1 glutaredoxin 3 [Paraperlucidibaca baekdonensis]
MAKVIIYTTRTCPFCVRAKQLLRNKAISFDDIDVSNDPEQRAALTARSGSRTVPQVFINDTFMGGCDELFGLERSGQLDQLTQA